jgi:transposase
MQGKISPEQSALQVYVGVDVCKAWLDVYLHPVGRELRVANTPVGIKALKRALQGFTVRLVVIEATGKLHRLAFRSLHASGFRVAVVNPYRSRKFADALGQLAKTDKIDARVLALLGESLNPEARAPAPKQLAELQEIVLARQAALAEKVAVENSLKATESRFLRRERSRWLRSLRERVKRLERAICQIVEADPVMARRFEVLISIPGIGPVVATTLIACLSEIGEASGKEIAALVGVAPFNWDSGNMRGQRHIKGGRAHVRAPLYCAALAAVRYETGFRGFAERLRAAGKPFKVIMTAVMRKLLVLANTLVRENRPWLPEAPKAA